MSHPIFCKLYIFNITYNFGNYKLYINIILSFHKIIFSTFFYYSVTYVCIIVTITISGFFQHHYHLFVLHHSLYSHLLQLSLSLLHLLYMLLFSINFGENSTNSSENTISFSVSCFFFFAYGTNNNINPLVPCSPLTPTEKSSFSTTIIGYHCYIHFFHLNHLLYRLQ